MSIGFFKKIYGADSKDFESVNGIDAFIEKKLGRKMKSAYMHAEISTCRGSVFPIEDMDVEEIFESALKK